MDVRSYLNGYFAIQNQKAIGPVNTRLVSGPSISTKIAEFDNLPDVSQGSSFK